jgi:hypothetical protein
VVWYALVWSDGQGKSYRQTAVSGSRSEQLQRQHQQVSLAVHCRVLVYARVI